jgi:hypothetical protein
MSCQVGTLGEPFVAARVGAEIRLLSGVGPQMCFEVEIQREPFSAQITEKWLLSLHV